MYFLRNKKFRPKSFRVITKLHLVPSKFVTTILRGIFDILLRHFNQDAITNNVVRYCDYCPTKFPILAFYGRRCTSRVKSVHHVIGWLVQWIKRLSSYLSPFMPSHFHPFIHLFIFQFIHSSIHNLIYSFTVLFIHSLKCSFTSSWSARP